MFRPTHRGFTLIELMVALAIVAALFSALVLGLGALTGARARKAMGELGAAARSLYDTAALTGNTCRLVLLLPRDDSAEHRIERTSVQLRARCADDGASRETCRPIPRLGNVVVLRGHRCTFTRMTTAVMLSRPPASFASATSS